MKEAKDIKKLVKPNPLKKETRDKVFRTILKRRGVSKGAINRVIESNLSSVRALDKMSKEELMKINGIGEKYAEEILAKH